MTGGALSQATEDGTSVTPSGHPSHPRELGPNAWHPIRVRVLRHRPLVQPRYFVEIGLVKPPFLIQSVFGVDGASARIRKVFLR